MLPFYFLIVFDTLPPVPDPADLRCPEPVVRFDSDRDFLRAQAYFGGYYGVSLSVLRSGLSFNAGYDRDDVWLAGQDGQAEAAIAIPFKKLWIRPFIDGSWTDRTGDYRRFGVGLETASDLPWFITWSGLRYDRWLMPNVYQEAEGYISAYGDLFSIIPQIDLNAIARPGTWTISTSVWLHAGSFHSGLGSALNHGFPAPRVDFGFRTPRHDFGVGIQKGLLERPLTDHFSHDLPYRYPLPLVSEELEAGIDARGRLLIGSLVLSGSTAFYDWRTRLAPDDSFYLTPIHDLSEWRADLSVSFVYKLTPVAFKQILCLRYDKTSIAVVNEPKYALTDTLEVVYGPVFTILEISYLHTRNGRDRVLPWMLLFNPKIGLRRNSLEVFCAVYNLNNYRSEIYEGYYPGSLTIVGGIGFKP